LECLLGPLPTLFIVLFSLSTIIILLGKKRKKERKAEKRKG
jgi:cbb3-type cytochrome oxidase subunit 3